MLTTAEPFACNAPADAAVDSVIGCANHLLKEIMANVPRSELLRMLGDPPAEPAPVAKRGKGVKRAADPERRPRAVRWELPFAECSIAPVGKRQP